MLKRILIRDILLIDRVELEFDAGLNVLTGETGAGKSILLDCLGFVLGWRGRAELVRKGAERGEVEAEFDVSRIPGLREIFDEAGQDYSDELIMRRINGRDGRKRAFINDRAVSGEFLRDVGACLLEMHGQHDDKGLLDEKTHLALLDQYAGINLSEMRGAFKDLRTAEKALEAAREAHAKAEADAEFIMHAAKELGDLDAQAGEETELDKKRRQMQQGEKLAGDFSALLQLLSNEGIGEGLADTLRRLRDIADKLDGAGDAVLSTFEAAYDQISDVEMDIARLADNSQFDALELERIEERLFAIRALARKYGVAPDALSEEAEKFAAQAAELSTGEGALTERAAEVTRLRARAEDIAKALHDARLKSAKALDVAIMGELAPLKMENAIFTTEIREATLSATGTDQVRFTAQTNPGTPAGSISKIASGGELSRFLLALKLCLHDDATHVSMIFDEIDRGVGGQTADAVGRRLRALSERAQLLVVTHSPQVAAQGTRQFIVEKAQAADETTTNVAELDNDARTQEIARMISGDEISDEALKAAARLIGAANE